MLQFCHVVGAAIASCVMALGVVPLFAQGSTMAVNQTLPPWSACEQERLLGHVRSVTVWSGEVLHGTSQVAGEKRRRSTIVFSDDGRAASETEYHGLETSILKYDFNATGKLTRLVLLNGSTLLRTTECRYDDLDRLASSSSRTSGGDGEIQYSYTVRLLTVRMVPSAATVEVLTYAFDSIGRPVLGTSRDEATGARLSEERYEYKDGGRERCNTSPGPVRCAFERIDDHEHVIERIVSDGVYRDRFDYDDAGNWVMHLSDHGSARDSGVWRDITYR